MAFWLSKTLWFLVSPANVLLMALVAGLLAVAIGWRRVGVWLIALATAMLLAIAILPVGPLMEQLEDRFPMYENHGEKVDGIIVLGGSVSVYVSTARGQVNYGYGERLTSLVTLAHRYPEARLVFTGGSGSLKPGPVREADIASRLFDELGLDIGRVLFERESRNTFENAKLSKELVKPKEGETWLLVTSAFHMPRAVGCFRKVGWNVTPYPVDYTTAGNEGYGLGFQLSGGLRALDLVVHEWLGLIAYYFMGRSSEWFPGP
jgi:uncharacterized SAM-binding protein YcdF (DUF218 family)